MFYNTIPHSYYGYIFQLDRVSKKKSILSLYNMYNNSKFYGYSIFIGSIYRQINQFSSANINKNVWLCGFTEIYYNIINIIQVKLFKPTMYPYSFFFLNLISTCLFNPLHSLCSNLQYNFVKCIDTIQESFKLYFQSLKEK